MSEIITCPSCRRKLNLREEYLGQTVRCPACGGEFTAEAPEPFSPRPVLRPEPEEPPDEHRRREPSWDEDRPRRRPRREDAYEEGEAYADRWRYRRPHRGAVILTLGILGLALFWIPLAGWILGGIALGMGSSDEAEMARGAMDRSGRGQTQAGKICGLIAVILSTIWFFTCCTLRVAFRAHL